MPKTIITEAQAAQCVSHHNACACREYRQQQDWNLILTALHEVHASMTVATDSLRALISVLPPNNARDPDIGLLHDAAHTPEEQARMPLDALKAGGPAQTE